MRRGELWTVAGGGDYTRKPRPALILQSDRFDATDSITICTLTSEVTAIELFRVRVEPTAVNGLDATSQVMADKVSTVQRSRIGVRIGRLEEREMAAVNVAAMLFLGLSPAPVDT